MSQQERLRHQLEIQSLHIEQALRRHRVEAQVDGGQVEAERVRFEIRAALAGGLERLRELSYDLAAALGVENVALERRGEGRWRLTVEQKSPSVTLPALLDRLGGLSPLTALLGLTEEEQPFLLDLTRRNTTHILVAGSEGAGKSTLLRTMALSLALGSRQSDLQLVLMEPEAIMAYHGDALLPPLGLLPHTLAPVVDRLEDIIEILHFLVQEADYRAAMRQHRPHIAVFMDDVDLLLDAGRAKIREPLHQLLRHGRASAIHLVMSARSTRNSVLGKVIKAYAPMRLVGRVADSFEARSATGLPDTGTENLLSAGDFLALNPDIALRFQAATISAYDLHHFINRLLRPEKQVLLAQSFDPRPTLRPDAPELTEGAFRYDHRAGRVVFEEDDQPIADDDDFLDDAEA